MFICCICYLLYNQCLIILCFFFYLYGDPRDLHVLTHSFPTRRSSDLLDPPHEMWKDYLPEHLRALAPYIEEGEEHDWIVFEGERRPMKMINNQAGRQGKDFKMSGKRSQMRAAWLPEQRLADMNTDGIDAAVMFGGGPLGTANSEAGRAAGRERGSKYV